MTPIGAFLHLGVPIVLWVLERVQVSPTWLYLSPICPMKASMVILTNQNTWFGLCAQYCVHVSKPTKTVHWCMNDRNQSHMSQWDPVSPTLTKVVPHCTQWHPKVHFWHLGVPRLWWVLEMVQVSPTWLYLSPTCAKSTFIVILTNQNTWFGLRAQYCVDVS